MVNAIRFHDLTIRRGSRDILGPIDWTVGPSERWVVLGPNGAGKSTLLQVAAAMTHPTSGWAEVLGERLGSVDVFDLRPRIGVVSPALAAAIPPAETVRDVVLTAAWAVTGRWHESYDEQDTARARAVLRRVGASNLANREFATLSQGERKRVEVARALMTDPELLLLDEPAAGLDLGSREALVDLLSGIAGDPGAGAQVVVTHHVEEIPAGCTHALLLRAGRVVAAGPIAAVLTGRALSETFGVRLRAGTVRGRYWARGVRSTIDAREPSLSEPIVRIGGRRGDDAAEGSPAGMSAGRPEILRI